MGWWIASALFFWLLCILLSYYSRQDHPFVDTPSFVVAGVVVLFLGFAGLIGGASVPSRGTPAYGALFLLMAFVPGLALLAPWIVHSVGIFTNVAGRAVIGLDQMKVERTYDTAEKLMHERKFDEAERAFLAGAAVEADDPEPLRRAGEAALAAGRAEGAVGHFHRALPRITSEEDRASLAIRIAEIQERSLGNPAGARRTLEEALAGLGPGTWSDYVRKRMSGLRL